MKLRTAIAILCVLALVHVAALNRAEEVWSALPRPEHPYALPGPVLRLVGLEYKGVLADFLFLKSLVFIGKNIEDQRLHSLPKSDWEAFHSLLTAVTDLDPYFVDPYYLGNAYLSWQAGMPKEANALLEKGIQARSWDWSLPFFAGFNCFYFLNDNDAAIKWLHESARRPGSTPTIGSLASRLAFKEKRTETAILYLQEVLKDTSDPDMQKQYRERIRSMQVRLFLERAVESYRRKFGRKPRTLEDLISKGVIGRIPANATGGYYYLDASGELQEAGESLFRH